ncbi:MAG: hypothetical protein JST84_04200 [Acidobacteria bacterium]|nr:hypothetical protein [Acidobacteriota bacterium]
MKTVFLSWLLCGCLLGVASGQDVTSKGAASAMQSLNGAGKDSNDPFTDIAAAQLAPSCDLNSNHTRLQSAQNRLSRLQAALADVRAVQVSTVGHLGAGDSLNLWSKLTGGAQVTQGLSDGFMSMYGYFSGSKSKEWYEVGKNVGDCANTALISTGRPGECIGSLAKSVDKALPDWAKVLPLGGAGNAVATFDNWLQDKPVNAAASAASTLSQQLKSIRANSTLTKTVDSVGKTLTAADAIITGDIEKGAKDIPAAISKIVGDETGIGKAFDLTGSLFKAGIDVLRGFDTYSNAEVEGNNLNKLTFSNYKASQARESALYARIAEAQGEVDRLTLCQQQMEAAGLYRAAKKPETADTVKTPGTSRSLDDIIAERGKALNLRSNTGDNSPFLQTLKNSMQHATMAEVGMRPAGTRAITSARPITLWPNFMSPLNQPLNPNTHFTTPGSGYIIPGYGQPKPYTPKAPPCPPGPGVCGIR